MLFTSEQKSVIEGWEPKETSECEIRFGSYNSRNFETCVSPEVFYRVKEHLGKFFKSTVSEYTERTNRGIRERNGECIKKDTLKKCDNREFNFRVAVSSEKTVDASVGDVEVSEENSNVKVESKTRWSFVDKTIRYDLTTSLNCFRIEIELLSKTDVEWLNGRVVFVLQIIQDNYFIISESDRQSVLNNYKELLSCTYFIGAQPESLTRENIKKLTAEDYSVTSKVDGDRYLLFCTNGFVYLIDNNLNSIKFTGLETDYDKTLFDGELVNESGRFSMYLFDTIVYKGVDLRGKKEFNLSKRLDCVDEFLGSTLVENSFFKLCGKAFIFKTLSLGVMWTLDNIKNIDGLIFTPINEPYPVKKKWSKLLKWKDVSNTTIDFYSVKDEQRNVWKLYVQGHIDGKKETEKVLFDVSKLTNEPNETITFETQFDDSLGYHSGTVIEYHFDGCKFVPIRTRWDKTHNKLKHGNYYKVACDIWKYIQTPITVETLIKLRGKQAYEASSETQYFAQMRRFHNQIKQDSYNKYTNRSDTLLELCSGRGGDMKKWIYNQIDQVHGLDTCLKSIKECKERYNQELQKVRNASKKYKFVQMDITKSFKSIKNEYSNVVCNFGIHYLYQSLPQFQELMNHIIGCLETGGHFICTMVDSEYVKSKPFSMHSQERQVISYYSYSGKDLKVYMNGNNYLTFNNSESVIDASVFLDLCSKMGLEVVENVSFGELYEKQDKFELETYEKEMSFMYRRLVFRKRVSVELVSAFTKVPTITNQTESSIKLQGSDISLLKVNSWYELLEYVNYYKMAYNESKQKNEFDLSQLKKHNVVFVDNLEYNSQLFCTEKVCTDNGKKCTIVVAKNIKVIDSESAYTNYFLVLFKGKILHKDTEWTNEILEQLTDHSESNEKDESKDESKDKKDEIDYDTLKVAELKSLLKLRGLKMTGKKSELVASLRRYKETK